MDQIEIFREVYRERRDALLESLGDHMPPGTTWTEPTGGFYSWVTLPEGLDATAMLPRAVAALVAYVPGTGFYVGDAEQEANRRSLRLCYCYPDARAHPRGRAPARQRHRRGARAARHLRPGRSRRGPGRTTTRPS